MRVLLIEDELRLSDALAYIIQKNKFSVDTAYDGETGQDMAEMDIYDVIVLDIMLPKKNGLDVLHDLRAGSISTPIILLTAKDTVADRVKGLDLGADDYLIKPFATEELIARIRALGRRKPNPILNDIFKFGNISFHPSSGEVFCGESVVTLTYKELQIFDLLIRNKNQVLSKDQIIDRVWGLSTYIEQNNVEVYLFYLRKKLASINSNVVIETIRGVGYRIKENINA